MTRPKPLSSLMTVAAATALLMPLAACKPHAGYHPHANVPENHARAHKPKAMIDATIEPGELVAPPEYAEDTTDNSRDDQLVVDVMLVDVCQVERAVAFFEYDSAKLRASARELLADIATCFEDDGPLADATLTIVGHADPRGSADYNKDLARERAQSVAGYLEAEGLTSEQMDVASKGEAKASDEPEDWPADRKVVLRIES